MRCQAIVETAHSKRHGERCTRSATYTDGRQYLCTQHAKEASEWKHEGRRLKAGFHAIQRPGRLDRIAPGVSTSTQRAP